ncbi:SGNH/GDSL hydrolase family protein [Algoriphagus lutimaris]|uniref:SGNH/GDSL hydrolase family protein n=1 Tax=Algoriphagus lutimaris TaxID=613197 RepID=UPI00196A857B|nr:SGNH/GDSL hydrolase family protein [Algoriphagus lutimaris]MBN3519434.1 SGNH/GDSL hydrolase family protein [Algoriphagus lutimaris]
MKKILFSSFIFLLTSTSFAQLIDSNSKENYLNDMKDELTVEWPKNKTINLVFHGHSVPAGYFKTPEVNTLNSYPFLALKGIKEAYPFAVVNVINTSIGGENSNSGQKRFKKEVLPHQPNILFIDYALNDRGIGLDQSRKAWEKMIVKALKKNIKVILLTPSPDLKIDLTESGNELDLHRQQIIGLAKKYQVGLVDSYSLFQKLKENCNCLNEYMSQGNHPNEKGHQLIAKEILTYF